MYVCTYVCMYQCINECSGFEWTFECSNLRMVNATFIVPYKEMCCLKLELYSPVLYICTLKWVKKDRFVYIKAPPRVYEQYTTRGCVERQIQHKAKLSAVFVSKHPPRVLYFSDRQARQCFNWYIVFLAWCEVLDGAYNWVSELVVGITSWAIKVYVKRCMQSSGLLKSLVLYLNFNRVNFTKMDQIYCSWLASYQDSFIQIMQESRQLMDGVVTGEWWQQMDQTVEWYRFACVISERRNLTFAYGRDIT